MRSRIASCASSGTQTEVSSPARETSFSYDREVQPRPKLKKWSTDWNRILKENAGKTARERLHVARTA
jgi:hypothetical protein